MGFTRGFDVYRHPVKGYRAIKRGFSWPGFFFSFVWSLFKGLWGVSAMVLLANIALKLLADAAAPVSPVLALLASLGELGVGVFVGVHGNDWRRGRAVAQGFELLATETARSPGRAISAAARARAGG